MEYKNVVPAHKLSHRSQVGREVNRCSTNVHEDSQHIAGSVDFITKQRAIITPNWPA
jgi:hypothetical protein